MVPSSNVFSNDFNERHLCQYVYKQLCLFFPDDKMSELTLEKCMKETLGRVEYCLSKVKLTGYTKFNYLHSDIYAQFLYFLSNTIWNNLGDNEAATKIFYLNKILHSFNCMYDTKLPDVFLLLHTVGTVLGKAHYSNYLVFNQNVTIGANREAIPYINEGVYFGPKCSVVGNSTIAKFSFISNSAIVFNQNTIENSVVIGASPHLVFKKSNRNIIMDNYFKF